MVNVRAVENVLEHNARMQKMQIKSKLTNANSISF